MTRAKVTRVIDGDTFRVKGGKTIRLAKVRAPEIKTKGGQKARADLRQVIGSRTVDINTVGKSYGRDVANVRVRGKLVNQVMRNKGYTNKGR